MKTLVILILCLLTPAWGQHDRQPTGPEVTAFTDAMKKLKEDCTDPAAWAVVKEMPRDYFLREMVRELSSLRFHPVLYETMRKHVMDIPDWDQWLFGKMEEQRKIAEAMQEGTNWPRAITSLGSAHGFLWMISDQKAVTLMAPT
jgi:hypothetical protein